MAKESPEVAEVHSPPARVQKGALEKKAPKPPAARSVELSPMQLIGQAIDRGMPVETIERLMALRDKAVAELARNEFFDSMARMQA